ncbi:hypothetical protein PV326_000130 [Microctonus aethiopoides]|nr:hypothetical protein PV326_000130 [Microctonus aethiopoides]
MRNPKKLQQRRDYAAIQSLWKRNRCKAAKKILDGDVGSSGRPSLATQERNWRALMEDRVAESCDDEDCESQEKMVNRNIFARVSVLEVKGMKPNARTAAGPDGLSTKS